MKGRGASGKRKPATLHRGEFARLLGHEAELAAGGVFRALLFVAERDGSAWPGRDGGERGARALFMSEPQLEHRDLRILCDQSQQKWRSFPRGVVLEELEVRRGFREHDVAHAGRPKAPRALVGRKTAREEAVGLRAPRRNHLHPVRCELRLQPGAIGENEPRLR